MINLRWIPMALFAAVLVFAVACGGDDDSGSTGATGANTGASTGAATGASTGSASTGSAPTGSTGAATGSTGSIDLDSVASSLENVDSFRFNMTIQMDVDAPDDGDEDAQAAAMMMAMFGNMRVEGAYVAPDRVQTRMNFFGMNVQAIQIGNEAWTNDGSGWVEDPSGDVGSSLPIDVTSPESIFDFIPADELEGARTSRESVNGVQTTRYTFDKDALEAMAQTSGEDLGDLSEIDTFNLDLWLTDDGLPVKMVMQMEGLSEGVQLSIQMEYNITDINDSSIRIDRPV